MWSPQSFDLCIMFLHETCIPDAGEIGLKSAKVNAILTLEPNVGVILSWYWPYQSKTPWYQVKYWQDHFTAARVPYDFVTLGDLGMTSECKLNTNFDVGFFNSVVD